MKIYYIISSLEGGGAEFIIPTLAKFFEKNGHSFKVFACLPRDMETTILLEKENIPYQFLSLNGDCRFLSTYNLIRYIRKSPPDLIWTSLARGAMDGQIAGKIAQIPVISWKHSAHIKHYKACAMQHLQKLSQLWVADSDGVARFLQTGMKVSQDRIMTWPLFHAPKDLPVLSVWKGEGIFHIGSMGRLHSVKNYDLLIRAIYYINQNNPELANRIKLSIAGAGEEEMRLKQLIADLNLQNVELVGFYSNVMEFLKTLHLYTQPSTYEGICIAAHEAMAVGLPVVATPVGEMCFCIEANKIGRLVSQHSVEALAEAILDFFYHPEKTKQCGQNAKAYIQARYTSQAFEAKGNAILNRIESEILPQFKRKRHCF